MRPVLYDRLYNNNVLSHTELKFRASKSVTTFKCINYVLIICSIP